MTQEVNPEVTGVRIETPEQLGFLVADWHRDRMHHLMALIEAPAQVAIAITLNEDEEEQELSSERERKIFQRGVEYAVNMFAELPFVPVMEEANAEASDQNPGDGSKLQ